VQVYSRIGQPKTQRTYANVDRVRTLVRLDRRLDVTLRAEELNMYTEIVYTNYYGRFGNEKNVSKDGASNPDR
jgi:hypothetical protein